MKHNILAIFLLGALSANAQPQHQEYTPSPVVGAEWNKPGNLNPFIPGYFADPTIKKFGDTFYLYATTDGTGNGYGPAQVWVSKDFVNWKNIILNWPTTEVVWAPDVVQQPNGKYRYFYCEPCNVNIGESDSPLGPWNNILGKTDAVMVPDRYVHNVITLDPQLFTDDDGSQYLYFTTWGIYDGFGCGVAKLKGGDFDVNKLSANLSKDGRMWNENAPFPIAADEFFSEKKLIPNTELKDVFEAPFVFKRNGIYYFTYSSGSCHTDTYRVQYAMSTEGPMCHFKYMGELLTTNENGTVHGPGHHSILQDGDDYYIVYHRHDIPKAIHGFNRQVCIDKLEFNEDGTIKRIVPTHDGVLPASLVKKANKKNQTVNLAYGAKVTASSYYNDFFKPEYLTDDNNATLWKARSCNEYQDARGKQNEWVEIDLGKETKFNQIWTQFEYATFFYQYRIETSLDGTNWMPYAQNENNVTAGSPMIDEGQTTARYIRITITDTQKNGHFPAIWNVKVYNATKKNNPKNLLPSTDGIDYSAVEAGYPNLHKKDATEESRAEAYNRGYKVVDINADDYRKATSEIKNRCGGRFSGMSELPVEVKKGKYAFYFNGQESLSSDFSLPKTMTYNAPYTVCAWVLNPEVEGIETVAEFTQTRNDLSTIEFRQGTDPANGLVAHNASFENFGASDECLQGEGQWQFWVDVYDGYTESIYCNGKLVKAKNSFLMIRPEGNITLGASMDGGNKFSGYLHSLKFFDKPLSEEEIQKEYNEPSGTTDKANFDVDNLQLSAKAYTPYYIDMSVVDADGKPLNTGLLTFSYTAQVGKKNDTMVCTAEVKNDEGQVIKTLEKTISVDPKQFKVYSHPEAVLLSTTVAGLEEFNANPVANGAKVYEELEGDFVVEAKVSDFDGYDRKRTPAYNEAGIIALEENGSFIQNGVFPSYNCGNMLTQVRHGRPQFPVQNGWNYDKYLQLQRIGNLIYARHSADGMIWKDMPGSPLTVRSKKMKVGVYQTTYTDNKSWAVLSDFVAYQ